MKTGRNETSRYHIMMIFLVIVWGLEYAVAKDALDHVNTMVILNIKYFFGALFITCFALRTTGLRFPDRKDIPLIIGTTILGHIIYFYAEYTAMDTVPVANITVIFGFLPIGSVLVEKALFRRRMSRRLILFMLFCCGGIFLTIGGDFSSMKGGKGTGYLMCVIALLAWLGYLFLTENIAEKYGSVRIAFYQVSLAWFITAPLMAPHVSDLPHLPLPVMGELIYLGIVSEGICFIVEVTGLEKLGPTVSAVYSNFLPVTTAFFGMVLLGQDLVPLQYAGGALVILCGCLVIREKSRLDRRDQL